MDETWHQLLRFFNTREIATGIWLLATVVATLFWNKTRSALIDIFKIAPQWKLVVLFGSLALYMTCLCWGLFLVNLWTIDQVGSSTLWFLMSGVVLLGRSLATKEDDQYFRNIIKDSLKVGFVFEFIVVAHTFDLIIELTLVPILFALSMFLAVSQSRDEFKSVSTISEVLLGIFGLILLWHSVSEIWSNPEIFFTSQTGRNFLFPLFMTIGSLPIFYLWYVISNFENVSGRISYIMPESTELQSYTKRRILLSFLFKPWLQQRAARQIVLLQPQNKEIIDHIINEIKRHEAEVSNPPPVDSKSGWCPYLSREYLSEIGLRTGDYHALYDGNEWWASSPYVDLDENILPNSVAFYISGEKGLVTNLKLSGNFYADKDFNDALSKFIDIAINLIAKALDITTDEASVLMPDNSAFETIVRETKISGWTEEYPSAKGFTWFLTLSRTLKDNNSGRQDERE